VAVEDGLNVLEAVTGEGGDLWCRSLSQRQAYDRRTAQIVKREAALGEL
jgi:hypothetical protein